MMLAADITSRWAMIGVAGSQPHGKCDAPTLAWYLEKCSLEYKAAIVPLYLFAASARAGCMSNAMASSYFDHLSPGLRGPAAEVCPVPASTWDVIETRSRQC